MTILQLVNFLIKWANDHSWDAQIAVPSDKLEHVDEFGPTCRKDIVIERSSISTVLTSRGEEVEW